MFFQLEKARNLLLPMLFGGLLFWGWWLAVPVHSALAAEEIRASGTADGYGYNWNNGVPFKWIDATVGTKLFPEPNAPANQFYDDAITGTIPIGFAFPFYEDTYSDIYITTNGIVGFNEKLGNNDVHFVNYGIPTDGPPQGFIAPFWDDLTLGGDTNDGAIYTLQGEESGQKYFVVEWHHVSRRGEDADLLFQTILYENGNILFSYSTLSVTLDSESIGIEDTTGINGLQYQFNDSGLGIAPGMTIQITRPSPAYRAKAYPIYQGGFVQAGKVEQKVFIRNSGNSAIGGGIDSYTLAFQSLSGGWTGQILNEAGTAQVSQTPNLAPAQVYTATVRLFPPAGAKSGADTQAVLLATSTKDTQKKASIRLDGAVPAAFVAVSSNDQDGIQFQIATENRTTSHAVASFFTGSTFAIFNGPGKQYIFAQEKNGRATVVPFRQITEIEFVFLDRAGKIILPFREIADHSLSLISVFDTIPQMSTAPNGNIGVTWLRTELERTIVNTDTIILRRDNIYFALLDANGNLIGTEQNVTKNPVFGGDETEDLVTFQSPEVQATNDSMFVLAYEENHLLDQTIETSDIGYTIFNGYDGTPLLIKPKSATIGFAEGIDFYDPALVGLVGNKALLAFSIYNPDGDLYQIVYQQITSAGSSQGTPRTMAGVGGFGVDGVQLVNGNVILAWGNPSGQISAAVLDPNFGVLPILGPINLVTPDGHEGANVSVTSDQAGNGILMWEDSTFGLALYYALLSSSGIVTEPMIFEYGSTRDTFVQTNRLGAGAAHYVPYTVFLPITVK